MRNVRVWIGLAISVVFLYVAFREQDFEAIGRALRGADYGLLVPAIGLYFVGVYLRAYRWSYVLRSMLNVPASRLFPVVTIGYMANNVLPLRAGEFVRSYVLASRTGLRKTSILATIALERLFDGLTMLLFMVIASLFIAFTDQLLYLALIAAGLFAVILIILALLTTTVARKVLIQRLVPALPDVLRERSERLLESVFTGLRALRNRNDMAVVSGLSVIAWLFEASMYLVISIGFGLGVGIAAMLLVTAVANLATLIPSSPGYIGPFEAGVLLALVGAIGVQRELALSFAIVVHAALYVPVTLVGLIYWWRESLSWREIRRLAEQES